ncbi:MAG: AbrB/MazE/SpoVT family DNA-binding domain-containing protein, partial [Dehalococcoidia bacterium]
MKTRIQRWGNSLALRIPQSFAAEAGLQKETAIDLSVSDGKLIITPLVGPGFTLKQLLSKINDDNLHHETDTGKAV